MKLSTADLAARLLVLSLALGAGACVADDATATTAHERALTGSPILLPWSGTGQDREVMSSFDPLVVELHDTYGQPLANVDVQFTSPSTGASAWFKFGGRVSTDATGRASIQAYANAIAGTYLVHASVDGADPIPFVLTNMAAAPALAVPVAGTGQGALAGQPFPALLEIAVVDSYGNAVEGAPVRFVAPATGATTAMESDGHAITDAAGHARVHATAGTITGTYTVTAQLAGAPVVPFVLTNLGELPPSEPAVARAPMLDARSR